MNGDWAVPEADAADQREPAGDETTGGNPEIPADLDDRPEADVLEQARPVEEHQIIDRPARRDYVNEADWLEQTIGEPVEDERR